MLTIITTSQLLVIGITPPSEATVIQTVEASTPTDFSYEFPDEDSLVLDDHYDPFEDLMAFAEIIRSMDHEDVSSSTSSSDKKYRKRRSVGGYYGPYGGGGRYLPHAVPKDTVRYGYAPTPNDWTDIGGPNKKLLKYSPSYLTRYRLKKQFDEWAPPTWYETFGYPQRGYRSRYH